MACKRANSPRSGASLSLNMACPPAIRVKTDVFHHAPPLRSILKSKNMQQMPDEVLARVMENLDVEQLFTCRLVCKRFRDFVRHPAVWRSRDIDASSPVLGLAPLVQLMRCEVKHLESRPSQPPPYATTGCAAEELELDVHEDACVLAALVVRNQEKLGRLRCVQVRYSPCDVGAPIMLETLLSTAGLEKLVVRQTLAPSSTPSTADGPVLYKKVTCAPSLVSFDCELFTRESEDFCKIILGGHAATLEEVNLCGDCDSFYYLTLKSNISSSSALAPLLAACPKLRSLKSPLLPGMAAVAACSSLRAVHFPVSEDMRHAVQDAADLLSRATQVREVTLDYVSWASPEVDVGLIRNMGPSVESLTIRDVRDCGLRQPLERQREDRLKSLPRALPNLPTLRRLAVSVASWYDELDELLLGLSPDSAPALRTLVLEEYYNLASHACAHAWVHRDSVRKVLRANPTLRVSVPNLPKCCPEGEACSECDRCDFSKSSECQKLSARVLTFKI
ncbi:uncharacterized protein LOC127749911 [Frankliniella occidentalis]|uniref:Uncharacterized protein LOC127749911 n=1 Tax=Frankliniella occidentalis TaxID=133901 RepID=A0A9C6WZF9_FRAOC|nr:uncharacterized protein LOC127749911 [Frankliniella occidentalis]